MVSARNSSFGRKLVLMLGASGFLSAQLWLQDKDWSAGGTETLIAAGALAIWGAAMLFLVGPWLWNSQLEDERTSFTRHRAFFLGYAAMMVAAVAFFGLALTGQVQAPEAIHLTLAVGIAAPLYGFAFLD